MGTLNNTCRVAYVSFSHTLNTHLMQNKYLLLIMVACTFICAEALAKRNLQTDTLFILPVDVHIQVVHGKQVLERNTTLETELEPDAFAELTKTLSNRYVVLHGDSTQQTLHAQPYVQKWDGVECPVALPSEWSREISAIPARYILLLTVEAEHHSFKNSLSHQTLYINPIIDNYIRSHILLMDKETETLIYLEKKFSKTDIRLGEALKRDVKALIKKVYYKKTPNCR